MDGVHFQIDAAPEFRLQCLHGDVRRIDYFLLTHGHSDHIAGMDDLRRFCDLRGGTAIPVFSTAEGLARVLAMFPYAIAERPIAKGYPAFALTEMPSVLELPCGVIRTTSLPHGGVNTLGLVFEERSTRRRLAYYTDCKRVPREATALALDTDILVIDGLRPDPHPTHLSIPEALAAAQQISAKQTYLVHLTHLSEHAATERETVPIAKVAYDGLRVILN
jgi:phosphoribosyl 1,2-cyclic phosphate phosphodiesterase